MARQQRMVFDMHDDDRLVKYLAQYELETRPVRNRDRTGFKIYRTFVVTKERRPWGTRHTAEQWRCYYVDNAMRLDCLIQKYREELTETESGRLPARVLKTLDREEEDRKLFDWNMPEQEEELSNGNGYLNEELKDRGFVPSKMLHELDKKSLEAAESMSGGVFHAEDRDESIDDNDSEAQGEGQDRRVSISASIGQIGPLEAPVDGDRVQRWARVCPSTEPQQFQAEPSDFVSGPNDDNKSERGECSRSTEEDGYWQELFGSYISEEEDEKDEEKVPPTGCASSGVGEEVKAVPATLPTTARVSPKLICPLINFPGSLGSLPDIRAVLPESSSSILPIPVTKLLNAPEASHHPASSRKQTRSSRRTNSSFSKAESRPFTRHRTPQLPQAPVFKKRARHELGDNDMGSGGSNSVKGSGNREGKEVETAPVPAALTRVKRDQWDGSGSQNAKDVRDAEAQVRESRHTGTPARDQRKTGGLSLGGDLHWQVALEANHAAKKTSVLPLHKSREPSLEQPRLCSETPVTIGRFRESQTSHPKSARDPVMPIRFKNHHLSVPESFAPKFPVHRPNNPLDFRPLSFEDPRLSGGHFRHIFPSDSRSNPRDFRPLSFEDPRLRGGHFRHIFPSDLPSNPRDFRPLSFEDPRLSSSRLLPHTARLHTSQNLRDEEVKVGLYLEKQTEAAETQERVEVESHLPKIDGLNVEVSKGRQDLVATVIEGLGKTTGARINAIPDLRERRAKMKEHIMKMSTANQIQCCAIVAHANRRCKNRLEISSGAALWSREAWSSYDDTRRFKPEMFCHQHAAGLLESSGLYVKGGSGDWVEFADYIPSYLSAATQIALRIELEKPRSASDVEGYIYTFEIRDPDDPLYLYLKVGRAINVVNRVRQWERQCGSKEQVLRGWYPVEDNGGQLPTLMKGRVAIKGKGVWCHRLERLVHLELADLATHGVYLDPNWKDFTKKTRDLHSTSSSRFYHFPPSNSSSIASSSSLSSIPSSDTPSSSSSQAWVNLNPPPKRGGHGKPCLPCDDCGTIHREIFAFRRVEVGALKGKEWEGVVRGVVKRWGDFVGRYL